MTNNRKEDLEVEMDSQDLIYSKDGPMAEVIAQADLAADTTTKVLITGESGVGKELLAQRIHNKSRRSNRPFMAVNCAGVTESILQAEIFGHVKGSFTGAEQDRKGKLQAAHQGTLFLDEVGDMTQSLQALFLRAIETGVVEKVGDDRTFQTKVDVRFISATNRDLPELVDIGSFRADLLYRLNVFPIRIPPLRDRRKDIFLLLNFFTSQIAARLELPPVTFDEEARSALAGYHWPGNVRELINVVERLTIIHGNKQLVKVEHLPTEITTTDGDTDTGGHDYYVANRLYNDMVRGNTSFWQTVYDPYMERDLTRSQVRAVIRKGLIRANGNYKLVAQLYNVGSEGEYKRFLNFLRKHECHLDFSQFRRIGVTAVA